MSLWRCTKDSLRFVIKRCIENLEVIRKWCSCVGIEKEISCTTHHLKYIHGAHKYPTKLSHNMLEGLRNQIQAWFAT
jgi:hypothetical protein